MLFDSQYLFKACCDVMLQGDKAHMLFLQLPDSLPVTGVQQEPMETDQLNSSRSDNPKQTSQAGSCDLSRLPTGYLGKIQVHKSGRVK